MKNSTKFVIAVIAIIVIIAIIVAVMLLNQNKQEEKGDNPQTTKSNVTVTSAQDLENLISKVYEGLNTLPTLTTTNIDLTDENAVASATGLTSTDKIDAIVASEPMMSSQAYSFVLIKVKNPTDADAIAKEVSEKINPVKWICVSAEKVYTTSSENIVCLAMASEEWIKPVYDKFKSVVGQVGQEYERSNSDNFDDMPDDGMISAQ